MHVKSQYSVEFVLNSLVFLNAVPVMTTSFLQQRTRHGPASGKTSNIRKCLYAAVIVVLLYFLYSMKFLFSEGLSARQNLEFERTGSGSGNRRHRREKADAIRETQGLRSGSRFEKSSGGQHSLTLSEGEDSIFQFSLPGVNGEDVNMGEEFAGKYKVMLIVNVASKCTLTELNYRQLNELYRKYHSRGLEIVAVPCDQFRQQEPGSNREVEKFIREEMHAEFPVMGKVDVNGRGVNELFRHLRAMTMNGRPLRGNFAKFLVDARGLPVLGVEPKMEPRKMEGHITLLLDEGHLDVNETDSSGSRGGLHVQ